MHSIQVLQNHGHTQAAHVFSPADATEARCRKEETASLSLLHGDTCRGIGTTGSGGDPKLPFWRAPHPGPCTWAEEGGRPGAWGLSGQTGRDVLAKLRGWRRPGPACRGREGELQLVKTGMKERDSSVPPPDSSPEKSSSYAPAQGLLSAQAPCWALRFKFSLCSACELTSPQKGAPVPWNFPPGPCRSGLTSSQPPGSSQGP